MINDNILYTLFKNGEGYYIGEHNNNVWFLCVDNFPERFYTEKLETFENLTILEINKFLNQEISKNIPLNNEYPPFQIGFKLKDFENIFSLTDSIKECFDELKLKQEDFVIPFIGGIGLNYKKAIIELLQIDELSVSSYTYVSKFKEIVKNYLKSKKEK
jgi:hypothetical protein